jgi:undecaprenyl diphosphate synthase
MCIEQCSQRGVEALTLFAFSSENWRRPIEEVGSLMRLFLEALDREVDELHQKAVRMRFIGERRSLAVRLQARIAAAEARTAANAGLKLQVAMSYGGRWDIVQAAQSIARECASGRIRPEELTEDSFAARLSLAGIPEPDLFIRTGGEQRVSNFLLWDLAYAELYFTPRLWPDFALSDLEGALAYFAARDRRFGRISEPRTAAKAR